MFTRINLLIVVIAIAGAGLGLLAGDWFDANRHMMPRRTATPSQPVLRVGDPRADLVLPDRDGKVHHLSEWDGKLVLLNFWATWCGPCREEMPVLQATHTRLAPSGLEVIGVAIDDADAVRRYLKVSPVDYPILTVSPEASDPSLLFGDTHSVLPFSVLIGRDGKVLAQRASSFDQAGLDDWLQPFLAR